MTPPGLTRRSLLRSSAAVGAAGAVGSIAAAGSAVGAAATEGPDPILKPPILKPPILKPLPSELFTVFGTNAETKWSAMRGVGYHTPIDRFFVRNHTSTPVIDASTWRLRLFGTGLRGNPSAGRPLELSYAQLRALPAHEVSAFIECTGNGRSYFGSQQSEQVSGTAWKLGAVGVARWRGVRLSTVLRRAGISPAAVDVMPVGLDDDYVADGVNHGRVRRPLPVEKALDDVLLAYEMNGRPLPRDHGFPVRLVVPNWIGIASIKWVGSIEVSARPLSSPWDTVFYRLFGPNFPAAGSPPLREQVVKSAFELSEAATFRAGRSYRLTGRSWSGHGAVRTVQVSTDGGTSWRRADVRRERSSTAGWVRWEIPWRPGTPGERHLLARATDRTGVAQPDVAAYNTLGYLFDGVVRHPVTVAG